jgi:hypothetical protein
VIHARDGCGIANAILLHGALAHLLLVVSGWWDVGYTYTSIHHLVGGFNPSEKY